MGLPLHLRSDKVYRDVGDRCGGFVEVDESLADLGCVQLRIRSSESTQSHISVRWGSWQFSLPVWVEADPSVAHVSSPVGLSYGASSDLVGHDLGRFDQSKSRQLGLEDYL